MTINLNRTNNRTPIARHRFAKHELSRVRHVRKINRTKLLRFFFFRGHVVRHAEKFCCKNNRDYIFACIEDASTDITFPWIIYVVIQNDRISSWDREEENEVG